MSFPISVIIPSYNRPDGLRAALESLAAQSLDPGSFEVVVVDDGSTYQDDSAAGRSYPFAFHLERTENGGATQARRRGVALSSGRLLVFMDDDITLSPAALAALSGAWLEPGVIGLGNISDRVPQPRTGFARRAAAAARKPLPPDSRAEVSFVECNTQLLALHRRDYDALGGLQDPTGGWPNWDDVDLGYRAHQAGFRLIKCGGAVAYHWDQSLTTLRRAYRRWYRAAHAAARLFDTYPDIRPHLPMFEDKVQISWREDPWPLIIRKLVRPVSSGLMLLWLLEHMTYFLDKIPAPPHVVSRLERWVIGGYIYRGLRDGRRKAGL